MFSGLAERLSETFKKLRGKGRLNEADIKAAMRDIKLALLEADVSIKVVKPFIAAVSERAVGQEVMASLTPAQQIVKIVNEEMTAIMGGGQAKLQIASKPPTVVMMCGLQGAGKTTHSAKLAGYYKKQGKRPLLVACDVVRPAAIQQLCVVGEAVGVPVFEMGQRDPVEIAEAAIKHAQLHGNDMVFLDTAGRLHVDEALMDELRRMKEKTEPTEILLTVDAMTGQDAVNAASAFHEALGITGVILTKTDGDTRGGAALTVKYVTGQPIKFIGTGEKLGDIEPFFPDRMASRILGMGDVLSLIEKAQESVDAEKMAEAERRFRESRFTLTDCLEQFAQLRRMGPLDQIMGMIPGVDASAMKGAQIDEKQFDRMEAIILSMTPAERERPELLNASRKQRIAKGSGTSPQEINRLLKMYEQMKKMMKQFSKMSRSGGRMPRGFPFR